MKFMVKCTYCRKGRPKLWNKDGGFCNETCYENWRYQQRKAKKGKIEINDKKYTNLCLHE